MALTLFHPRFALVLLALALTACGGGGGGGGDTAPQASSPATTPTSSTGDTTTTTTPPPATVTPSPPLVAAVFQADGFTYTPDPVMQGRINGFSRSEAGGAGISSREIGNGATVWYGGDSCVGFQSLGTGKRDRKGGTNTRIWSFPWIAVSYIPGTTNKFIPTMRGVSSSLGPLSAVPDPAYDRTAELKKFTWGVRVASATDPTVFKDSNGLYDFVLLFEDGSTVHGGWDPASNGPSSHFFVDMFPNQLRDLSHDLPSQNQFCMMKEQTSMELEPRCVTNSVNNPAGGRQTLCYMGGMLEGDYTLTTADGKTVEAGKFERNHATAGWTFWRDDGSMSATGSVNAQGLPTGDWKYYDSQNRLIATAPYSGLTKPAPDGTLFTWLDGTYSETFYADPPLFTQGRVLNGQPDSWWDKFRGTAKTESDEYDASTQIKTGSACYSPGGCIDVTTSRVKRHRGYIWSSSSPYVNEVTYFDSAPNQVVCYSLGGTPQEPVIGAVRPCPTASSQ